MTDIRNGVNAGKTVTVHDTQITLNGWSGTGYTILDPESGAGAYMIGGGLDGGFLQFIGDNVDGFALALGMTSILATFGTVGFLILVTLLVVSFFVALLVTMATNLILIENGCSSVLVALNTVLNMAGFLLTAFLKGVGQVIFGAIANFIYNSFVPAASPLCQYRKSV